MLILSRVCAEFRDRAGQTVFIIPPAKLLSFLEAPEAIREDPLFDMMLRDGSLEAVHSVSQLRDLESNPAAFSAPDGKRAVPSPEKQEDFPEEAAGRAPDFTDAAPAPSGKGSKTDSADATPSVSRKSGKTK